MKKLIKKVIGGNNRIGNAMRNALVEQRVASAKKFLEQNSIYTSILPDFIADYRYSILVTFRGVMQVVNLEEVVQYIGQKHIVGAFVECGTFTGGASAFALRSLMRNEPDRDRRWYYGFDSFEGMPEPTIKDGSRAITWMYGVKADSMVQAKATGALVGSEVNFADFAKCQKYLLGTGYPETKITLVKGWFQRTLPEYRKQIGPIAILRIDGDFYESTKICLETLFDQIVTGGVVILDDYGGFPGSRKAVDEFLQNRHLDPFLHYVDESIRFFLKP